MKYTDGFCIGTNGHCQKTRRRNRHEPTFGLSTFCSTSSNLPDDKSGSIVKVWQELLTEFPHDKKCTTFEYLVRVIYSTQDMSVNTVNEYASYLSNVHEVTETLGRVTFNVKEVMFLMEMTNFQGRITRYTRKFGTVWKWCLTKLWPNAFKTNITGKKMTHCCGWPVHCVNFDGTWRDIDPRVIHAAKASKTRALLTGVESGDFIDSEGNLVSVDADFSRWWGARPCESDT